MYQYNREILSLAVFNMLYCNTRGGTKMEDAADLYTKSAHAFKMAKKYSCEFVYSE